MPVNAAQIEQLWSVYLTDATLQACRTLLFTRLLSGGLAYADAKYSAFSDQDFHDRVQSAYVPFCRDVIDSLCVQGFAVFMVDRKRGVPYVVPRNSGSVLMRTTERLQREMAFIPFGESKPDRRALFVIENWPDVSGAVISPVSSFRRAAGFRMMVELNTAIADYGRARPLVYTTSRTDHVFNMRNVYPEGERSFANPGNMVLDVARMVNNDPAMPGAHRHNQAQQMRAESEMVANNASHHESMLMRAHQQQQMLVRDLNYGVLNGSDVRLDPATGLPVFDTALSHSKEHAYNVVPLPVDTANTTTVMPSSRADLVQVGCLPLFPPCVSLDSLALLLFVPGIGADRSAWGAAGAGVHGAPGVRGDGGARHEHRDGEQPRVRQRESGGRDAAPHAEPVSPHAQPVADGGVHAAVWAAGRHGGGVPVPDDRRRGQGPVHPQRAHLPGVQGVRDADVHGKPGQHGEAGPPAGGGAAAWEVRVRRRRYRRPPTTEGSTGVPNAPSTAPAVASP